MSGLLALLVACGFTDADLDQDGFSTGDGDCDDLDDQVFPGALEVPYDGQVQDCQLTRDPDDLDQDGHIAAELGGPDCDDLDARRHPGNWEVPSDGVDQNCDGLDVTLRGPWRHLVAGDTRACGQPVAVDALPCWGPRASGSALSSGPARPITRLDLGLGHACALGDDGEITCWGNDVQGETAAPPGPWAEVSAGALTTCALDMQGTPRCWGSLTRAPEDAHLRAIDSGRRTLNFLLEPAFACGVLQSGPLYCWSQDPTADEVFPGEWTTVSVGTGLWCAVAADGSISCWGEAAPSEVPPGPYSAVATGFGFACGLRLDGAVACWGRDDVGQATPPGGSFVQLTAGRGFGCGLRADGEARCWGDAPQ